MDKLYAVWLPKQGWLKVQEKVFCGDLELVQQVAKQWGGGAKVYRIDPSLIILETQLLERERAKRWLNANDK